MEELSSGHTGVCIHTYYFVLRRDPEPFLQLPWSLKSKWIVANLKFMFYREFVKLTFYLNSKLNRSYWTIFFPEICILKIFWKMGMKFIKGWQQQGNLSWHCFIILYQSAYISYFFSLYVITFFTIWICITLILLVYFTIACDVQRKILFYLLLIKVLIVYAFFWYVKSVLLKISH